MWIKWPSHDENCTSQEVLKEITDVVFRSMVTPMPAHLQCENESTQKITNSEQNNKNQKGE